MPTIYPLAENTPFSHSNQNWPKNLSGSAGWKFHLNVTDPNHQQEISDWFKQKGVAHKIGRNSGQAGKEITAYIGSRDNLDKITEEVYSKFGDKLLPQSQNSEVFKEGLEVKPNIFARFDVAIAKEKVPGMKETKENLKWTSYGKKGTPYLANLGWAREQSDELHDIARNHLAQDYGEFFTGSKNVSPASSTITSPPIARSPVVTQQNVSPTQVESKPKVPDSSVTEKAVEKAKEQKKSNVANKKDPKLAELEKLKRMNRNLEKQNLLTDEQKQKRISNISVSDNRNTARDVIRGENTPLRKQLESMAWDLGQGELEAGRSKAQQLQKTGRKAPLQSKSYDIPREEILKRLDERAASNNLTVSHSPSRSPRVLTTNRNIPKLNIPKPNNLIEMTEWEDPESFMGNKIVRSINDNPDTDMRRKLIGLAEKAVNESNIGKVNKTDKKGLPEHLEDTYESEFKSEERPLPWKDPTRRFNAEEKIDVDSYGTPIYDRSGLSPSIRRKEGWNNGLGLKAQPKSVEPSIVKGKEREVLSKKSMVIPNESNTARLHRQQRYVDTHVDKSISYMRGGVFAAGAIGAGIGRYMAGEGEGEKAAGTGMGLVVGLTGAAIVGSDIKQEMINNKAKLFHTLSDLDSKPFFVVEDGLEERAAAQNVKTDKHVKPFKRSKLPAGEKALESIEIPRSKIDITKQTAKREAMRAFHEANSASLYKGKNAAMLAATALLAAGAGLAFNTADKSSGLNSKRGNRI